MTSTNHSPPKVFISYSHDSPEHRVGVFDFAEKLRKQGVDAWIDQYEPWPEKGWPHWMQSHIAESDFVLMVCSPTYYRRVTGKEEPGVGRGVCWESHLIYNQLYAQKMVNKKFIPVFFDQLMIDLTPEPLRGYPSYVVNQDDDYQKLYAIVSGQPEVSPAPLGALQVPQKTGVADKPQQPPQGNDNYNYKYFISYSRKNVNDENLARFLYDHLTELGHEVFIDIGIKVGADWLKEIKERIHGCDYLLLLLSPTSINSEMVVREVRMAATSHSVRGKPQILPIRLQYEGPLDYELDLYIGRLQYTLWQGLEDSQRVLDSVTQPHQLPTDNKPVPLSPELEDNQPETRRPEHAMDLRLLSLRDITAADSKYISRPEDHKILAAASEIGETVVIKAPNQMGKSSLLARYIQQCKKVGKQTAVIDFAIFGEDELSSYSKLLSNLAWSINDELEINDGEFPEIKNQTMMVSYVRKSILAATEGPLTIAFDEVDRVMGQPYSTDFFTMLRSFHNSRARSRWGETDLVLVISTEPYLLITESQRSPFNVVPPLILLPFTRQECEVLNASYDQPLQPTEMEQLYALLCGHPYLTRLAFYQLKDTASYSLDQLLESADDERGPFGEHLRAKLADLQEGQGLVEGMKKVLDPTLTVDRDMAYRLHAAGLICFRDHDNAVPANLIYHRYFKRVLNV